LPALGLTPFTQLILLVIFLLRAVAVVVLILVVAVEPEDYYLVQEVLLGVPFIQSWWVRVDPQA
jgi:hypothetical protein